MIHLAGSIGILIVLMLISGGIGFAAGLYRAKRWLSKEGCYMCNEAFQYQFGFDDED
jgi:uncharacterized membrane protein YiaA